MQGFREAASALFLVAAPTVSSASPYVSVGLGVAGSLFTAIVLMMLKGMRDDTRETRVGIGDVRDRVTLVEAQLKTFNCAGNCLVQKGSNNAIASN